METNKEDLENITAEDIKKHLISMLEKANKKEKQQILELMRKIFSMFTYENDIRTENKSE